MAKRLFSLRIVTILCILLVACNHTAATQPTQISFYKRGYQAGGKDSASVAIDRAIEAFGKQHPDIQVRVVGVSWDSSGDAMMDAAIQAGSDIDVMSLRSTDLIRYARAGKLSALAPHLSADDRADFYTNALEAASVDGKVYAWPLWVTAVSIFANRTLFEQRGVELPTLETPWTWQEFIAAAQQLTFQQPDGTQVYGFSASSRWGEMEYYPLLYLDGGRILSPDGRQFIQRQAEGVSALQKIADLRIKYRVTPDDFGVVDQATVRKQFRSAQIAMLMSSPGFIRDLENENFPLSVLPTPIGKSGSPISTGAFGLFGVYNHADERRVQAAHELARYLTGSQVAQDVPGWQLAPSLRRSNTSYATTPNRDMISRLVRYGLYEPPVLLSDELLQNYGAALEAVLQGQKSAQAAMDEIAPMYQHDLDTLNP